MSTQPTAPRNAEVRYQRIKPGRRDQRWPREVTEVTDLAERLERGDSLAGLRLQGLDLRQVQVALMATDDAHGMVVLGGRLTPDLDEHLRRHGAIIFPTDPRAPIRPYRGHLYTADELYEGLSTHGYRHTPDAQAYTWFQDAELRHDAYVSVLRAIHDDAMSDALVDAADGRVAFGVMGGHSLARGTPAFDAAAGLGFALAQRGALVLTGGGPGAMEAANLGAASPDATLLATALETVAEVPHFADDIDAWVLAGLRARRQLDQHRDAGADEGDVRSIGIPTWYYGHEPPNVFGDLIAKFFSNALREDLLLHHSSSGLVVLPGAAGTVQEVFQMATRLYYPSEEALAPIVLVGHEHWTTTLPVWPLLQALGAGRPMAAALHLVDDITDVPDLLLST